MESRTGILVAAALLTGAALAWGEEPAPLTPPARPPTPHERVAPEVSAARVSLGAAAVALQGALPGDTETAIRALRDARDHVQAAIDDLLAERGRPLLRASVAARSLKPNVETVTQTDAMGRPYGVRVRRGSTLSLSVPVVVERVRGPFVAIAFEVALDGVAAPAQHEYAPVRVGGKAEPFIEGARFTAAVTFHVRDHEAEQAWQARIPLDALSKHVTAQALWIIYKDGTKVDLPASGG
jgi:hypothetical protein